MALFLAFVSVTTFAWLDEAPALKFWVGKFLEIDPLIAVATALTTHTLYKGLTWSLIILIPTLLLGRFFCNWICPYGILHHFIGFLGWRVGGKSTKDRIDANRYRPIFALKYCILAAMLVAACFGTLQIGLLDPICLFHRSFTVSVAPALSLPPPVARVIGDPREYQVGWIIGGLLVLLVSLNFVIPRFFCRVLCPLGALLGLFSRVSLWRIDRDPHKCTNCDLCLKRCEGASDPQSQLRKSECMVCLNCIDDCPQGALRFAWLPQPTGEKAWPDVRRRRAIYAGAVGVLFFPFARLSGRSTRDFSSKVVRPPGSLEELEFLKRCLKCGQCIRVCPTNALQPAAFEPGVEGVWTPVMNYRMGACQYHCTACGHVCPTGAIRAIALEEKLGYGSFASQGPIRLGTAHYDWGRCLPWSKNIPCVVCEEVCPVSPKAIHSEYRQLMIRDGKKMVTVATPTTVTLVDYPPLGMAFGESCDFTPGQFKSDSTTNYYIRVVHRGGTSETHRIISNDVDMISIGELDPSSGELVNGSQFVTEPSRGDVVEINMELKLPKIDASCCIGCGLCEKECPVVGDQRAIRVTPDGETRSRNYLQQDRNRSLRLLSGGSD